MLLYVAPAVVYIVLLFTVSSLSKPPAPEFGIEWGDKINHAGAYGLMLLFVFRAVRYLFADRSDLWQILIAVAFVVGYGVFDEIYQTFVPGRDGDVIDWLADVAGAMLGAAFVRLSVGSSVGRLLFGPRVTDGGTARR